MKKLFTAFSLLIFTVLTGQNYMVLSFSGDDQGNHVTLDSLYVHNVTQGCDTLIYPPDTTLSFVITGVNEVSKDQNELVLHHNYPNPFVYETLFKLTLGHQGKVEIRAVSLTGSDILKFQRILPAGTHCFKYVSGKHKISFLRVTAQGQTAAIKMLVSQTNEIPAGLSYLGETERSFNKSVRLFSGFFFSPGDQLLVVGYAEPGQSGMITSPDTNMDYILQFATNTPCLGMDSILYSGQWYPTIQVFNQCWFKENLNAGTMVLSSLGQSNNGTIEKYCMGDINASCDEYGGLYSWDEMMQYSSFMQQGICPEGWHIPTDIDWKILEGATDSQSGIGDPLWNLTDWRGFDTGANLKEEGTQHWWAGNTGTDVYGFTALPGGYFVQNSFWGVEYRAVFWSGDSSMYSLRVLDAPESGIRRQTGTNPGGEAFSVRCIRDNQ